VRRARRVAALAALSALGACTLVRVQPTAEAPARRTGCRCAPPAADLDPLPLDPGQVTVTPAERTVGDEWILHLYTWFHSRDYRVERVEFPGSDGERATAYLSLPGGGGRHPAVIVFPILAGSHVVSEALSKALVNRGYAVLHMQRRPLDFERAGGPEAPASAFRHALRDARAMLGWLGQHPEVDGERLAAAGVSLGGIMAATLMGIDPRVRAGYFAMTGGDLAEILYESTERPVRAFRRRLERERGLDTRDAFVAFVREWTEPVDPLSYSSGVSPETVLLVSGRFDRVVPRARTHTLWEALGRPTWRLFPAGHYQFLPFFWWAAGEAADHFDRALARSGAAR
jgi:hypothetical protein